MNIVIRKMEYEDIPLICIADKDASESFKEYIKNHLQCQHRGECSALIALYEGKIAGHLFLYYKCRWGGCGNKGLPSIVDLKVFECYRNKGIASRLMDVAENIAVQHGKEIYLDVCLNSDYGAAQRFYTKRGYIPDGNGVYYGEKVCQVNAKCVNDDELTLCLIKKLSSMQE